MKDLVGYDTVVMNWLISLYGGRGFLYGVHNNELFNLNYAAEFLESTEVRRLFGPLDLCIMIQSIVIRLNNL